MYYDSFIKSTGSLANDARILDKYGFRSAALFYYNKNDSYLRRAARVTRCCFEETELPGYEGTMLYPSGIWSPSMDGDDPDDHGLRISYAGEYQYDGGQFGKFTAEINDPFERLILERISNDMEVFAACPVAVRHRHYGAHWVTDHAGILREGLAGYKSKILGYLEEPRNEGSEPFYEAMLDTVEGLIILAGRVLNHLRGIYAKNPLPHLIKLISAFGRVPVYPAQTFYEAVVCTNFFIGYASASELGRLDQYLNGFYLEDMSGGLANSSDAEILISELVTNVNARVNSPGAWHMVLGGGDAEGRPSYNGLTEIALKVMGRFRQPNTSIRVRKDMPEELWEAVLDNLGKGIGNPALINEEVFLRSFKKHPYIQDKDISDFSFAGCTETLIGGKTNAESIGAMLNLPEVLEQCIMCDLAQAEDFDRFYNIYKKRLRCVITEMLEQISLKHRYYAAYRTEPVRSLFTQDCLCNGKGYYQGGARYNFENISVYGLTNVLNSLYTLKQIFLGKTAVDKEDIPDMLCHDYKGYDMERAELQALPKFGNACAEITAMAEDMSKMIFGELNGYRCPGGVWHVTPSMIGWTTFVEAGKYVGATPDGRKRGEALADSSGPVQGTDREGPTEVLLSAAAIAQEDAMGTCVLNLMLGTELFDTAENRERLKSLFKTYFELGGMQLQVSVVDEKVLEDAMLNPAKHEHLIVRIAGYNDYFTRQSIEIRGEILKRTRHV